jgi:hypothetical protein
MSGARHQNLLSQARHSFLQAVESLLMYAGRTREALEALNEAETLAERSEERWWCAELHRLRCLTFNRNVADELYRTHESLNGEK